jgi:hypothetical protein
MQLNPTPGLFPLVLFLDKKNKKSRAAYSFYESLRLDKPRNPSSQRTGLRMAWVA